MAATALRLKMICGRTQGSSCLATLGFGTESRWDSRMALQSFINFSTFAFTLSSILMSGGQARLKFSPGGLFVASMPSLLPMAILLVA